MRLVAHHRCRIQLAAHHWCSIQLAEPACRRQPCWMRSVWVLRGNCGSGNCGHNVQPARPAPKAVQGGSMQRQGTAAAPVLHCVTRTCVLDSTWVALGFARWQHKERAWWKARVHSCYRQPLALPGISILTWTTLLALGWWETWRPRDPGRSRPQAHPGGCAPAHIPTRIIGSAKINGSMYICGLNDSRMTHESVTWHMAAWQLWTCTRSHTRTHINAHTHTQTHSKINTHKQHTH